MGIAYRMAIIDGSRLTNRKIIYDNDPVLRNKYKDYNFIFIQGDYESYFEFVKNDGFGINIGFYISYAAIELEIRYSKAIHDFGQFDQIHPIEYKTHTIHFLIGIQI